MNKWVSGSCLLLSSFCFILLNVLSLDLSYAPVLFYHYYPLDTFLFSKERHKVIGSTWKGKWAVTGRSKGKGNCKQDMLGEKTIFSIKKKGIR